MNLIALNHALWAVDLRWQKPQKRPSSRKKLLFHAHEIDPGYDVVARTKRHNKQLQEGFGSSSGQWKRWIQARSLAACLNVGASFLGLFPLETVSGKRVWWLCCRIDGVIPERGDQVFCSHEEARNAYALFKTISGVSEQVHTESVEESCRFLAENLKLSSADRLVLDRGRLLNINRAVSRTTVIRTVAGICLTLFVAGSAFGIHYTVKRAEYEAARQAQLARLQRQKDLKERPEKFFKMAWQTAPLATDMARSCLPSMFELPLSSNGWIMDKAVCAGKTINLEWKHEEGGNFIMLPDNGKADPKNARLARSQRPVIPIAASKREDGAGTDHTVLASRETVSGLLSEISQATGTKLNLSFKAQERKTIEKIPVVAPWFEGTWELSAVPDLLMDVGTGEGLFEMLSEIPGLTVESITYHDGWSVKGKSYAIAQ